MKLKLGIVAGGPEEFIPKSNIRQSVYKYWMGVDRGALYLAKKKIFMDLAVGDFDSVTDGELDLIRTYSNQILIYPADKAATDLELALEAIDSVTPEISEVYIYGATGGRMDHSLANVFLLKKYLTENRMYIIVDQLNELTIYEAGTYEITNDYHKLYISFIPLTEHVINLTLTGFLYPLEQKTVRSGETLTLSNKLIDQTGYFSFASGIVLVSKSSDLES